MSRHRRLQRTLASPQRRRRLWHNRLGRQIRAQLRAHHAREILADSAGWDQP